MSSHRETRAVRHSRAGGGRAARIGIAVALLALVATAQAPVGGADLAARWSALRDRLDRGVADDGVTPIRLADRLALLEDLVQAGEAAPPDRAEARTALLEARCRLARLRLACLEPRRAQELYAQVLREAPTAEVDLRGRAAHGIALALELLELRDEAARAHERVIQQFVGTRYADWSRVAKARLTDGAGGRAEIGRALPEFGPRQDETGAAQTLQERRGAPALVVVFSADDPSAGARVRTIQLAATASAIPDRQLVAIVLHAGARRIAELRAELGLRGTLIPSGDETLDPALLRYGITATPTWFLVGPDGTLLARNPPPARVTELLDALRRPLGAAGPGGDPPSPADRGNPARALRRG
ncbi:MAG: hypothetical protein IPM29_12580 [Planctomycetes bacterium]|nr:hypothetical protein [Planctomycetota bacterium]